MNGYITDIEQETLDNENFRQVLYTTLNSQLVVLSLQPGEEIGKEVHGQDQFIRIEAGEDKAVLNGEEHKLEDGIAIVVPAGSEHNIINGSEEPMKLYTIYSPPHHIDGIIHKTKKDSEKDEDKDHFDGATTEE